jgi:hypothetical protein
MALSIVFQLLESCFVLIEVNQIIEDDFIRGSFIYIVLVIISSTIFIV